MEKLFKIPLAFLFVSACLGLFLRYIMIAPVDGVTYSYFLHGHSHVMFLGWVFNILFLAFVKELTETTMKFKIVFWILQVCVAGMLFSFAVQGYGVISIVLSTIHTITAIYFIIIFFKSTHASSSLALTLAKTALLFFALSSIGPFVLAYLKANGLDQSNLYRFAIYFYLHFQYNGFFFFGILGLLVKLIEHKLSREQMSHLRSGCYLLIGACIPAYVLSTLWASPKFLFNTIGFIAAAAQLTGFFVCMGPIRSGITSEKNFLHPQTTMLFHTAFIGLTLKLILQWISSFPGPALLADEYRSIVIAYLHLVLVGVISVFLIGWLIQKRIIRMPSWSLYLFLGAFAISELVLIVLPWNDQYLGLSIRFYLHLLFFSSALMAFVTANLLKGSFIVSARQ